MPQIAGYLIMVAINIVIAAIVSMVLMPTIPTTVDTGYQLSGKDSIRPRTIAYGKLVLGGPLIYEDVRGSGESSYYDMIICLTTHPIDEFLGLWVNDVYIPVSDIDIGNTWRLTGGEYGSNYNPSDRPTPTNVTIIPVKGWGWADELYVSDASAAANVQTDIDNDIAAAQAIAARLGAKWAQPANWAARASEGFKATNCSYIYLSFQYNKDVFSSVPAVKGVYLKGKRLFNPRKCTSVGGTDDTTHLLNDPTTWEWSENWALACLDYLLNPFYGLNARTSGLLQEVEWDTFIEATLDAGQDPANPCISGYPAGHPEATTVVDRYTVNGVLETNNTPISNYESLLTSGGGSLTYSQGTYRLRAGVYKPVEDESNIITENMIVAPIQIRVSTPRSELFNKAASVYVKALDEDNQPIYIATDAPLVNPLNLSMVNPYEVIDGEEIIKEFDYPFCIYDFEAQRLSRLYLERNRQGLVYSIVCSLAVLKYSAGDLVYLSIFNDPKYDIYDSLKYRLGLTDQVTEADPPPSAPSGGTNSSGLYYKQFRIVNINYNEDNTIALQLIEDASGLYEWAEGDAFVTDPAANADYSGLGMATSIAKPQWALPSGYLYNPVSIFHIDTSAGPIAKVHLRWGGTITLDNDGNDLGSAHVAAYEIAYGRVDNPTEPVLADRVDTWTDLGTFANLGDVNGPAEAILSLTDTYDFRVRALGVNSARKSVWAYYSDEFGDFVPYTTVTNPGYGDTQFEPDAPETILVGESATSEWYFKVAVDVGNVVNMAIEDLDYVELVQCARDRNPVDDYALAYTTDEDGQEGKNKIRAWKQIIPGGRVNADNAWIVFDADNGYRINSNVGYGLRGAQRAQCWFWARITTKSGFVSAWWPNAAAGGSYGYGDQEGYGPWLNKGAQPFDNFADPETGEVINIVTVDNADGAAGPEGDPNPPIVSPPGDEPPADPIPLQPIAGGGIVRPNTGIYGGSRIAK